MWYRSQESNRSRGVVAPNGHPSFVVVLLLLVGVVVAVDNGCLLCVYCNHDDP